MESYNPICLDCLEWDTLNRFNPIINTEANPLSQKLGVFEEGCTIQSYEENLRRASLINSWKKGSCFWLKWKGKESELRLPCFSDHPKNQKDPKEKSLF